MPQNHNLHVRYHHKYSYKIALVITDTGTDLEWSSRFQPPLSSPRSVDRTAPADVNNTVGFLQTSRSSPNTLPAFKESQLNITILLPHPFP